MLQVGNRLCCCTMLDAVQQDIRDAKEQVTRYEQKLARAEQAHNEEGVKTCTAILLSVHDQLASMYRLLCNQAPSKPYLQLVYTDLPGFTPCCIPLS